LWQHAFMSEAGGVPPVPGDIEQALALFRAQFAASLPARMQDANTALQACRAAPADEAPLKDLHRVLHRLAGSAGTFGWPEFGDACRGIEDELEALLLQPVRTGADFDRVAAAIAALPRP
jgi:HPt (histidine-containing phosphotransfer) domain-containing protein